MTMNKEPNNNEGERTAKEYVDTTLRSSHYNQTQRIEDATDGNTRKLSTIHKVVLSSIFCIVATWLCTGYVIYKHGSVLFNGDSIEGLREQIKTSETNTAQRYEANRLVAKNHRENRNEVEGELRDQIDRLHEQVEREKKHKHSIRSELKREREERQKSAEIIKQLSKKNAAEEMLKQAHYTIAENIVPLNLQQYIGQASDEQWIHYARMAVERNAYNVVRTIGSIPELMQIAKVAQLIDLYNDRASGTRGTGIRKVVRKLAKEQQDYSDSVVGSDNPKKNLGKSAMLNLK
jgi:hypothetical protein